MINDRTDWNRHRADLTDEETRGLEAIGAGINLLFIEYPDEYDRAVRILNRIAAERAENNRILSYRPSDEIPVPAGATAGRWEWSGSYRGWTRDLTWTHWSSERCGMFVRVGGYQEENGTARRFIYTHDHHDLHQPSPDEARAMAAALIAAADLMEAQK